jgi:hypothetical protein
MSDWTALGRSIKNMLENQDCPLTEDQYLLVQGSIAGFAMTAHVIGIDEAMSNVANNIERSKVSDL